jgi:NAD(P)-dependent dehydrogenase (short-subunit alcohol dehydrogenase family)
MDGPHDSAGDFDLAGAVAVVTGATRGIGRETALRFGRAGARVVIVGRTTAEAPHPVLPGTLDGVLEELTTIGVDAHAVQADLMDGDDTQRVVEATLGRYGRCDVLVNNAAFTSNGPILDVPWGRWQKGFRLQTVAPLQLVQGLVPGMLERGRGRVVNISTEVSTRLVAGLALYSVTKLAMERLTEQLHHELGGRGVSFNALHLDRSAATETWRYFYDTQGPEVALAGGDLADVVSPGLVAAQIEWMIRRPSDWSGQVIGSLAIDQLGGPRDA